MFFPLHVHSHFSLQRALNKADQLANQVAQLGYSGCALMDYGSVSGIPAFLDAFKKKGLKAIAGAQLFICEKNSTDKTDDNFGLHHLGLLVKNQKGWEDLIKVISFSNHASRYHMKRPRLSLEELASFYTGNWFIFSGWPGTQLANHLLTSGEAYYAKTYEDARSFMRQDWKTVTLANLERFRSLFGSNFMVGVNVMDRVNMPVSLAITRTLRYCANLVKVPCVAMMDTHYTNKEDASDLRVLLASSLETTIKRFPGKAREYKMPELGLLSYFNSSSYYLPRQDDFAEFTQEEIENTQKVADACEVINISRPPSLPVFPVPANHNALSYLTQLVESGFKKKKLKGAVYRDRLKLELDVIERAGLPPYFLIVDDFVRYARETLKARLGRGRGSAAGCLTSYCLGITDIDPIRFNLLFERFYNAGRLQKDRVALPDIDIDFPVSVREKVIQYCRDKYGADNVCHMATFSRTQGRGAIKDVLRVHERVSFEEMNKITESIPDESAISDQLQEMLDAGEDPSIIMWALENEDESLSEWCHLTENGLEGPLSLDFAQAIRLEGTRRNMGKHASGIIISNEPLASFVPMVYDKSTEDLMVGFDMRDAEKAGLVKFDILGTAVLDVIMDCEQMIRGSL